MFPIFSHAISTSNQKQIPVSAAFMMFFFQSSSPAQGFFLHRTFLFQLA